MLGIESRRVAGLSVVFGLAVAAPAMAETNMLFILDSSNSMWGQIDGTAKIATAKSVLGNLLTDLPADTKVGLMAYGAGQMSDKPMLHGLPPRHKRLTAIEMRIHTAWKARECPLLLRVVGRLPFPGVCGELGR